MATQQDQEAVFLYDSLVVVLVGPESQRFDLHKGLMCVRSDFFKAALNGRFKEAEGKIGLPEQDSETFKCFVHWLYTGKVNVVPLPIVNENSAAIHFTSLRTMAKIHKFEGLCNTPAGRSSLSGAEKKQSEKRIAALEMNFRPFDPAARKFVRRLIALESNALDPRVTVCGISIKQSDINCAIREFANLKALEANGKAMQTSNSNLNKRMTILGKELLRSRGSGIRIRGSRDQWRRIAQAARPDHSDEEKEQRMTAELQAHEDTCVDKFQAQKTIINFKRRVDDLEAPLGPLEEAQDHFEEMRMIPVFIGENRFVMSPVDDTHACAKARKQVFADHAQSVMAMAKPPVRMQSLKSIAPQDWTRLNQVYSKKGITG